MKRLRHPDMTARLTGSATLIRGQPAHAAAMQEMLGSFLETHIDNEPYIVKFVNDEGPAVICPATGAWAATRR